MSRALKESRRSVWQDRLARQVSSGLTVAEFCRREGVSAPSLYHWRKRLSVEAQEASSANGRCGRRRPSKTQSQSAGSRVNDRSAASGISRGSSSLSVEGPGFVPVSLPASPASPWIELVLVDGSVIRLPQQDLRAL